MAWDDMTWHEMIDDMRWHDMTWDEMKWYDKSDALIAIQRLGLK